MLPVNENFTIEFFYKWNSVNVISYEIPNCWMFLSITMIYFVDESKMREKTISCQKCQKRTELLQK